MMFGAGVGMLLLAGAVSKRPRAASMREDAVQLNGLISDLIALGGCLVAIRGVGSVFEALKPGGARVDLCLAVEMQTQQLATRREPRGIWNPTIHRLAIRVKGESGAWRCSPTSSVHPQTAA